MFKTLVKGVMRYQYRKMLLITLTVALGASLMTAMLTVVLGVEAKINAELKTYGANIMVRPGASDVLEDLYGLTTDIQAKAPKLDQATYNQLYRDKQQQELQAQTALTIDSLEKIKLIFWSHNITNLLPVKILPAVLLTKVEASQVAAPNGAAPNGAAPNSVVSNGAAPNSTTPSIAASVTSTISTAPEVATTAATTAAATPAATQTATLATTPAATQTATPAQIAPKAASYQVRVAATTFEHTLDLASGENFQYGLKDMKNWWKITGHYPKAAKNEVVIGQTLANQLALKVGDSVSLNTSLNMDQPLLVKISGIVETGSEGDQLLYGDLDLLAPLSKLPKQLSYIEVQALTTPDNDLARKAAKNPKSLSPKEWDTWYCTAYVSAVCYQIEDALPGVSAKAIRQVSESEGAILTKTKALLTLIAILAMVATALGISNLVSNFVIERSAEIGLCKALGAENWRINLAVLFEIMLAGLVGASCGYVLGLGFAEIIAYTVFGSFLLPETLAFVLVSLMVIVVTILGSLPALRYLSKLDPKLVLHGAK